MILMPPSCANLLISFFGCSGWRMVEVWRPSSQKTNRECKSKGLTWMSYGCYGFLVWPEKTFLIEHFIREWIYCRKWNAGCHPFRGHTLQAKKMRAYLHHLQKFRCLFILRTSKPRYFKMPSGTPRPMSSWTAELEVKHRHWFSTGGNHHWNEHSSNISLIENHRTIPSVGKTDPKLGTKEFQRNWAPKIPKRSNQS